MNYCISNHTYPDNRGVGYAIRKRQRPMIWAWRKRRKFDLVF